MKSASWLVLAGLLQGCIIYEEHYRERTCRGCGEEPTVEDPGTAPEPEPEGPVLTSDLALRPAEAAPGEALLSTLVVVGDPVDLSGVEEVGFSRDVAVLDTLVRPDEVVLLLEVAAEAEPGPVDVFVHGASGSWLLDAPFEILDPAEPGCAQDPTDPAPDTGCP